MMLLRQRFRHSVSSLSYCLLLLAAARPSIIFIAALFAAMFYQMPSAAVVCRYYSLLSSPFTLICPPPRLIQLQTYTVLPPLLFLLPCQRGFARCRVTRHARAVAIVTKMPR